MKTYKAEDIDQFDKRFRANFINSLSGAKSANLIGTVDKVGNQNLAIFSSCFHLGANPSLLGLINRPQKDGAVRHTLNNIEATGFFTINDVHEDIFLKAHQTSARYPLEVSEFEAVGLTPEKIENFQAPFVKESHLKMACKLAQLLPIPLNDTVMIIGEIVMVQCDPQKVDSDGRIDRSDVIAVTGLDTYSKLGDSKSVSYAKPDRDPEILFS